MRETRKFLISAPYLYSPNGLRCFVLLQCFLVSALECFTDEFRLKLKMLQCMEAIASSLNARVRDVCLTMFSTHDFFFTANILFCYIRDDSFFRNFKIVGISLTAVLNGIQVIQVDGDCG